MKLGESKKTHRGRLQAQGGRIEESVSWNQDEPPTRAEALDMLQELEHKLLPREQQLRASSFIKAKGFINNAAIKNGVDAQVHKSFKVKGTKDARIDIEVISGKAFVEVENEN